MWHMRVFCRVIVGVPSIGLTLIAFLDFQFAVPSGAHTCLFISRLACFLSREIISGGRHVCTGKPRPQVRSFTKTLFWKRSEKVFKTLWTRSGKRSENTPENALKNFLGSFLGHRRKISFPITRTTQKNSWGFREVFGRFSGWFSGGFRDGFRDSFRAGFSWHFSKYRRVGVGIQESWRTSDNDRAQPDFCSPVWRFT